MDRDLKPTHLMKRIEEMKEAEDYEALAEAEVLVKEKIEVDVRQKEIDEQLSEMRLEPRTQRELETLEEALSDYKTENKIKPGNKILKVFKAGILGLFSLGVATAGVYAGMEVYKIYKQKSLAGIETSASTVSYISDRIFENQAEKYLISRLDTDCNTLRMGELNKAIKRHTGKGLNLSHDKFNFVRIYIKKGHKGIDVESRTSGFFPFNVTMSPETAYKLGKPYPIAKCNIKKQHIDL